MNHAFFRTSSLSLAGKILLLPACVAAALILAVVGKHFRAMERHETQTIDAARQVMFLARPDGSVQALHLRNTIGELGVLREPDRHQVRQLSLDTSGRHLWVLGESAVWHYDAHTLKLLERRPLERSDSIALEDSVPLARDEVSRPL